MYSDAVIKQFNEDQRLRGPAMKDAPAFYRNLEQAIDSRRHSQFAMGLLPRCDESVADFATGDIISLSRSGRVREAFLTELASHPDFTTSAAGSRTQCNYDYIARVEQEIAAFHGVETVFITPSGFSANVCVLSGVPLPGDAIVYDELIHASSHEGFSLSLAAYKSSFRHNDTEALRDALAALKAAEPAFRKGTRSILVCVETIYSMDGDVCPLREFVQVVKEEFPLGNAQFLVDEAHSLGVLGDKGRGLVSMLGLEKEIAIQVHVASKALGSSGGLVMCNKTIRSMLLNFARSVVFTGAPSFPMVASIRAAYQVIAKGEICAEQESIQRNVKHFFRAIVSNPIWDEATEEGLLGIPLLEDWEQRPFQTHIVPLRTRPRHEMFLFFHVLLNNINAHPMSFPVVPKGESRLRLIFHAHNTEQQIDHLVSVIHEWVAEMLEIERGEAGSSMPTAARQVYSKQAALN